MRDVEIRSSSLAATDPERYASFSRHFVHQLEYKGHDLFSSFHNPKQLKTYIQILFNGDPSAFEAALGTAAPPFALSQRQDDQLRVVVQGTRLSRADLHMVDRDTVKTGDVMPQADLLIRAQGTRMTPVINHDQLVGVRLESVMPQDFVPVALVRLRGALQLAWLIEARRVSYMQTDEEGRRDARLEDDDELLGYVVWSMPGLPLSAVRPSTPQAAAPGADAPNDPSVSSLQYA